MSFHIRASRVCSRIGFDSGCELGLNPGLLWVVRVRVRQPDLISVFVRGVRARIGQPDLTSGFERVDFELYYLRFKGSLGYYRDYDIRERATP